MTDLRVPGVVVDGGFAPWLRERLRQEGISQRELARQAGCSHSTISRLLSEEREPLLYTALGIVKALTRA